VTKTADLITSLTANMTPAGRLRTPTTRAACWLLLAVAVLLLLAMSQGLRPDFWQRLRDPTYCVSLVACLSTGVLAAEAAFLISLPDRSRLWSLLPVPALAVWLANIGYQCLTDWVSMGPDGVALGETARCFATLTLTGLPLSLALLVMLRHAARLRPTAVSAMGGLAVAAISAAAQSLFHASDATVMVLIWNIGMAVLFVGLGGAFGQSLFRWITDRIAPLRG
jgi:hypothetical protein